MAERLGHFPGTAPIDAYGNGGFRFADMSHRGSILCLPGSISAWAPLTAEKAGLQDFAAVFQNDPKPEFILFGTGTALIPPSQALRLEFRAHGIGLEAMDTGAAARTYNVLLGEGRMVGAALIAVS